MKALLATILLIVVQNSQDFIHWLENHLLNCPFKQTTGLDCPGCGFQRSVLALIKGDFLFSFKMYPATIPLIALVVFTLIHLRLNFKNGALFIKILYTSIAVIIVINYIYKIYNHQLI